MNLQVAAINIPVELIDHIRRIQRTNIYIVLVQPDYICCIHTIVNGYSVEIRTLAVSCSCNSLLSKSNIRTNCICIVALVPRKAEVVDLALSFPHLAAAAREARLGWRP